MWTSILKFIGEVLAVAAVQELIPDDATPSTPSDATSRANKMSIGLNDYIRRLQDYSPSYTAENEPRLTKGYEEMISRRQDRQKELASNLKSPFKTSSLDNVSITVRR